VSLNASPQQHALKPNVKIAAKQLAAPPTRTVSATPLKPQCGHVITIPPCPAVAPRYTGGAVRSTGKPVGIAFARCCGGGGWDAYAPTGVPYAGAGLISG